MPSTMSNLTCFKAKLKAQTSALDRFRNQGTRFRAHVQKDTLVITQSVSRHGRSIQEIRAG